MIAEYGGEALTKAEERVKELHSGGFDSVAQTWEMICEAIGNIQAANSDAGVSPKIMIDDKLPEGYARHAKLDLELAPGEHQSFLKSIDRAITNHRSLGVRG